MYASIRQGKAKAGMAEELTRRIKEGAIPINSDVEGFMAYYVVYAPDDTVKRRRFVRHIFNSSVCRGVRFQGLINDMILRGCDAVTESEQCSAQAFSNCES